jgi:hypothetical protein
MRKRLERFLVTGAIAGTLLASFAPSNDNPMIYALLGATFGGFIFVMAYR